jgi:tetrapyrrole methylase family protein/MazG family protein
MEERARELTSKKEYDINDLLQIMQLLRDRCPWDRIQTHESIRRNFIEETYEVIEAIDNADYALLREELGDVLLQVVFHARICEEQDRFSFADVTNDICKKLIERHPHIFGSVTAGTAEEVTGNWERIKQASKKRDSISESLEGIAKTLPSLMRAGKIAKKASAAGYSFPSRGLDEAGYGDMLFELAASASLDGFDPEKALYDSCGRFIKQFAEREKNVSEKVKNQ